jgi:hypothetical protein
MMFSGGSFPLFQKRDGADIPAVTMSKNATPGLQASGTSDRIEGPIMTSDGVGNRYSCFRCADCGAESDRKADLESCCQPTGFLFRDA